jgi:hypothetical protein
MIVGGTVRVMKRDSDRESVMSTFGQDLLYINVGFADKLKDEIDSDTNPLNTLLVTASRVRTIQEQVARLGGPADHTQRLVGLFYVARNSDVRYPATRLFSQQDYGL